MLVIVRHYKFNEEPTTFGKLGVGSLYITERQLTCLGDSASMSIKISACYAVSLTTGNHFRMASSTVVYKGEGQ